MIDPALWEPILLALQALPRNATDGERATAACKALPPGWFGVEDVPMLIVAALAFGSGVALGLYAVGARV